MRWVLSLIAIFSYTWVEAQTPEQICTGHYRSSQSQSKAQSEREFCEVSGPNGRTAQSLANGFGSQLVQAVGRPDSSSPVAAGGSANGSLARRELLRLIQADAAQRASERAKRFSEISSSPPSDTFKNQLRNARHWLGIYRTSAGPLTRTGRKFEFHATERTSLASTISGMPSEGGKLHANEIAEINKKIVPNKGIHELKEEARFKYEQIIAKNPFLAYFQTHDASDYEAAKRRFTEALQRDSAKIASLDANQAASKVLVNFRPSAAAVLEKRPELCETFFRLSDEFKETAKQRSDGVRVAMAGAAMCGIATVVTEGLALPCFFENVAALGVGVAGALESEKERGILAAGINSRQGRIADLERRANDRNQFAVASALTVAGTGLTAASIIRPSPSTQAAAISRPVGSAAKTAIDSFPDNVAIPVVRSADDQMRAFQARRTIPVRLVSRISSAEVDLIRNSESRLFSTLSKRAVLRAAGFSAHEAALIVSSWDPGY